MNRAQREVNAILVMWLRHMKGFLRTPGIILGSIFQPLLFMVAFGLGIGQMANLSASVNFFEFILAGIVGMGIIFSSIMGGISVLWDRK
ncbi:MAG: multidrug ABC transporter permease, partial [Gammaproteobacteria bacterium]